MEHTRRRGAFVWTITLVALALAALGAWYLFAPRGTIDLEEAAPAGAQLLKQGIFSDGAPGHRASGTVQLLRDADGLLLHFEDYDATAGPAVYFYLTRDAGASSAQAVEVEGVRLVPEAALRGAFNIRVPAGVDAASYGGLAAWCERFDVLFGQATLT